MSRNESNVDRIIRIVLGAVLLVIGLATQLWLLAVVSLIPLVTGAVGFCPLYRIFGISTCPIESRR